jgi:RNA polymerase sigma factor (TIGR02999 family)
LTPDEDSEPEPAQDAEAASSAKARGRRRARAEKLASALYDELHKLAQDQLGRERRAHTLVPTALVHEAYLRLSRERRSQWKSDTHFLSLAARAMRRVLIDYARKHRAQKRGGGACKVTLLDAVAPLAGVDIDILDLTEALEEFAQLDPRASEVVELRFFGGLTVEEVAEQLDVSPRTVADDWAMARSWLRRRLKQSGE